MRTILYLPSHLKSPKEKHNYLEVPDLETTIQRHNNWLLLITIGYNKILHKSSISNTDSFKT